MKRRSVLMLAVIGLGVVVLGSYCLTAESPPPASGVFMKAVPAALQEEISNIEKRVSTESPLSAEEVSRAMELFAKLNVKCVETRDAAREFFKPLGIRAVPFLAERLTATDDQIRHKGIIALDFLFKPRELRDKSFAETEQALLALSERSLIDRTSAVRISALDMLRGVALHRWPDMPVRAIEAMKSALEDPDERVRVAAVEYLKGLGVIPREPTDDIFVD